MKRVLLQIDVQHDWGTWVFYLLIALGIWFLLRPLWMWYYGASDILKEVRELRKEVAELKDRRN